MEFSGQTKGRLKQIEWPEWWQLAAVAAVVGTMAWFSITLTRDAGNVASIWLSNAALLGILLRVRSQHWFAYLLVGFLANFAADRIFGDSTALALTVAACNMVEAMLAAALLRSRLSDASDLTQRRTFAYFLFYGMIVAPIVSASLGAETFRYFTGASFLTVFKTWYLADAIGIALVTPLMLSLRRNELATLFSEAAVAKTLGIFIVVATVTTTVFAQSTYPLLFLLFPIMMWVIFELGFTGTAIAIFMAAIIAIAFTINGHGPMMLIEGLTFQQRILFLQITIATAALVALPIALILAERERLREALQNTNNELHSMAMTDALTGLANRRRFDEMLEREWRRTARESGVISLLLLDIDHFKLFNDFYGHQTGDECLQKVGDALVRIARRSGDVCARYGGEEFAVILPSIDAKRAMTIAELMRAAVETIEIKHEKAPKGRVTVSVGIASIKPRDIGAQIGDLVGAADRALYDAKRGGRNCTMTVH